MANEEIRKKLDAEFPPDQVKLRAKDVNKDKTSCLALAYLDARQVAERLNDVFGITGWGVEHTPVGEKSVKTRLTIHAHHELDLRETVLEDFGYSDQSENQSQPEHLKAAASDGLKRASVALGIGAYLYNLPKSWVEYDGYTPKVKSLAELKASQSGQSAPRAQASPPAPRPAPQAAPPTASGDGSTRTCPKCSAIMKFNPAGITKTGNNAGKWHSAYWKCTHYKECGFVEWIDDPAPAPVNSGANTLEHIFDLCGQMGYTHQDLKELAKECGSGIVPIEEEQESTLLTILSALEELNRNMAGVQ